MECRTTAAICVSAWEFRWVYKMSIWLELYRLVQMMLHLNECADLWTAKYSVLHPSQKFFIFIF